MVLTGQTLGYSFALSAANTPNCLARPVRALIVLPAPKTDDVFRLASRTQHAVTINSLVTV
jgi:hypothetical protein